MFSWKSLSTTELSTLAEAYRFMDQRCEHHSVGNAEPTPSSKKMGPQDLRGVKGAIFLVFSVELQKYNDRSAYFRDDVFQKTYGNVRNMLEPYLVNAPQ